jgi:DhnA family fructose-bisphosphate aldolase class Ia
MLSTLGHIVEDADTYGMPVLGIAYPRRDSGPDLKGVELAAAQVHAARVAVELGVHLVKVQMLDDPGAMREIVEACAPVPVLVAGGHLCDAEEWKGRVENSLSAGVSGVCVGRNVTDRPDSLPILEFLHNLRSR